MSVNHSEDTGIGKVQGVGQKCEIRTWQERYRKDGRQEIVAKDSLYEEDLDKDKPYAIVVREVFTDKNVLDHTIVQINSAQLLKTFREVIKSYPTVPTDFESPFEMESPFRMLYHYWDDLDIYRRSVSDDITRMHLNLLFDFMKAELGPDKDRCEGMIRKNQISFEKLWTIYRPGDLQYTVENGHPWILKMEKTAYEENVKKGKWLEVHCTYTDYDGTDIGQAAHIIHIYQKRNFAAGNPAIITDLRIFPCKFLQGHRDLEAKLLERGTRFLELQGVLVRDYDGLAQYVKDPPTGFYDPEMGEWPAVWLPYTVRHL